MIDVAAGGLYIEGIGPSVIPHLSLHMPQKAEYVDDI
jgi:hypothetical protein